MSDLASVREWIEYNSFVRRKYLEAFEALPSDELGRDRGASYPSLLAFHEQILRAILVWIRQASGGQTHPAPPETGDPPALAEVQALEEYVDRRYADFLRGLRERDLDRTVHVPKGGMANSATDLSVRDMLWHLVEEELQHRGEMNALLWELDIDPPVFDWIAWTRLRTPKPNSSHRVVPSAH